MAANAAGARAVFGTVAGRRHTVHHGLQRTVSRPSSTGADQPRVRQGLQRGDGSGWSSWVPWRDPYCRPDPNRLLLFGQHHCALRRHAPRTRRSVRKGSAQRYCGSLGTLGDSARLFALANLAGADAGIRAWNSKKHYNFWRPITAIQQALPEDDDGNPETEADAGWTSLIATPPYPDYTSGANNLAGSFTTIVSRFFNANSVTFKVTSTAPQANPNERTYHRFSDLADDVVEARIYLGIHFRFADTAARREGTRVATQAFNHFLRPVRGRSAVQRSIHGGRDGAGPFPPAGPRLRKRRRRATPSGARRRSPRPPPGRRPRRG